MSNFHSGQIVRLTDRVVFKIGVVVGPSQTGGKLRVSPWQNGSRSWSQPQAIDAKWVERIFPDALSARERAVIRRAQKTVATHGEVAWSGGALAMGKVAP